MPEGINLSCQVLSFTHCLAIPMGMVFVGVVRKTPKKGMGLEKATFLEHSIDLYKTP